MTESTKSSTDKVQWALVTGAARRIGAEIARGLHARGCNVIIHYHGSSAEASVLVASLNEIRADSAKALHADLSSHLDIERLAASVKVTTRELPLLVNNASRFYPTPIGGTSMDAWEGLLDTNLRGPFLLTQALLAELRAGHGCVINILDIHAERPMAQYSVYSAAKAALSMLTRSMALELAPDVRVNGVAPGAILWPEGKSDQAERDRILERIPMQRTGEPSDIAGAVAWLGLDAPYVTGQILAVDGGRSVTM